MATEPDAADKTEPKRRWLRFSLRSFLLFAVVLSIFFAWVGNILVRVHHQRNVVAKIQSLGGTVNYDYEIGGENNQANPPPGPKLIHMIIGDDAFAYVELVLLEDANKTSDVDLAILAEFPRLKDVMVYGPNVTDDGMEHIANIPNLRGLGLSDTNVTALGLARLHSSNDFVSLSLFGATVNDETLKTLNELPHLQYLYLAQTNVTSVGLAHVAELTKLRELKILVGPAIGDDGMQHLANLTNLESLHLFRTSVSDEGLQHLRGLSRLKSLNLDQTLVSDSGIDHLLGFSNLIELRLRDTNIGDAGIQTVSQIDSLQYLDLSGTNITDDGLIHIATMSNLESLLLSDSVVTDSGIMLLKSLPNLRVLFVGPNVTENAARELRRTIPECTILSRDNTGVNDFSLGQ